MRRVKTVPVGRGLFLAALCAMAFPSLAHAAEGMVRYREFLGLDSRTLVWIVAELHLMFGAFVLARARRLWCAPTLHISEKNLPAPVLILVFSKPFPAEATASLTPTGTSH